MNVVTLAVNSHVHTLLSPTSTVVICVYTAVLTTLAVKEMISLCFGIIRTVARASVPWLVINVLID